jgi:16S rRNA (guanine527-N7)-methyltransferase
VKHALTPGSPMPPYAAAAFPPETRKLAQQFADRLASVAVVRGLMGPREVPRLWDRHLLNCAAMAGEITAGSHVGDLGSGAGLPGLVLAIARPDLSVTLVEPLLRRVTFLEETVALLKLVNVRVVRGRAEDIHHTEKFDVVTSRAVAPMSRLLVWSMPLVSKQGCLLAMKGSSVHDELMEAHEVARQLGCSTPEVVTLTQADGVSTTTVVRVSWAASGQVG